MGRRAVITYLPPNFISPQCRVVTVSDYRCSYFLVQLFVVKSTAGDNAEFLEFEATGSTYSPDGQL